MIENEHTVSVTTGEVLDGTTVGLFSDGETWVTFWPSPSEHPRRVVDEMLVNALDFPDSSEIENKQYVKIEADVVEYGLGEWREAPETGPYGNVGINAVATVKFHEADAEWIVDVHDESDLTVDV